MTEAGRSPEPSLMAPPERDAEQDELIEDTVPPNGLMPAPPREKANGKEKPDSAPESAPESSAQSSPSPAPPASPPSPAPPASLPASPGEVGVPFPADGIHAPDRDDDSQRGGERFSATAAALNGKLDSGRQVVRQAVAATNNWITNRTAKSDFPLAEEAEEPGASGVEAPGTRASGASTDVVPATAGAAGTSSEPVTAQPVTAQPVSGTQPSTASSASAPASPSVASPSVAPPSVAPPQPAYPPPYPAPQQSAAWSASAKPPAATLAPSRRPSAKLRPESARRGRRQAHLTLARVEPWSVMKFSAMVSIVAFVILFVAIAVLYMVLSGLGVFTSVQHTVSTITSSQGSAGTNISSWFSASRILGYTAMFGAGDIFLITALSTIGAVVYNLIAQTIGGIEVTLRETE